MPHSTLLVLHRGHRAVSETVALQALGGMPAFDHLPTPFPVDTQQFQAQIDAGDWTASHDYVWRRAQALRSVVNDVDAPRVVYFGGMPEVPHALAFAAYFEDFFRLEPFDLRDSTTAAWPDDAPDLELAVTGVPQELVLSSGAAVLRVQLAALIDEAQIGRFVGTTERVADIAIRPQHGSAQPGLIRSQRDVERIRSHVVRAIAALQEFRPNVTVLHLFLAGPPSVAVAVGQALRLREGRRVQTYRHRPDAGGMPELTEAVLLVYGGLEPLVVPLMEEQLALARIQRVHTWTVAITSVQQYAEAKATAVNAAEGQTPGRWYDALVLGPQLARFRPFPALPPVHQLITAPPASLDPNPFGGEFGFEAGMAKRWRLNDHLVVRLGERFPAPEDALALARIFLFHEYLHTVHGITKPTASEVGKFANSLEHADYMCDLYGILHELDLEFAEGVAVASFAAVQARLVDLIDMVIRSFWAFEQTPARARMEYRRIRRYMNWYWQRTRVSRATSLNQIAAIVARKPIVELAGLESKAEGRRHFASLERLDPVAAYELCIVLDNERLQRIASSPTASLMELLAAFRTSDHHALVLVFEQLFEHVGEGALPPGEE